MMFWILIAGLTAAAALSVLIPLARRRPEEAPGAESADEAVYKEQLAAIDSELERGLIDVEAAEGARTETARRLLAAHDRKDILQAAGSGTQRLRAVQAVALVLLPVLALGLYLGIGSPDLPDQPLQARLSEPAENQPVEVLVARVEAHLADNPEDGQGWAVVAPVYMRLGRPLDSVRAYANALRLLGERHDWLTDMGEAMTVANEGMINEQARQIFERAVALEPSSVKPRFFLAIALGQEGRSDDAVAAWNTLLDGADPQAAWVPAARGELAKLTGSTPPLLPALKGPDQADVAAARDMNSEDRQAMIQSMVEGLAERLGADGGSSAEWSQLMRAYMVLGERDKALAALQDAETAFADQADDLAKIKDAAAELGLVGS